MGEILSHSEVEAILSALDFSPSASQLMPPQSQIPSATEGVTQYDFEHPVPLRPAQLGFLRLAAAATSQVLQASLTKLLHTSVVVNFLGVEQSTFRDYLATSEEPACLAIFESTDRSGTWLLDLSRSLAFTFITCLLGGKPSANNSPLRPFTDVETRLIEKAVMAIVPDLTGSLSSQNALQMTRLVSEGALIAEASSNEAVALVSFELSCGPVSGLLQLCIPWQQVAEFHAVPELAVGELGDKMRTAANQIPVNLTARLARLTLTASELADLTPGDVILTDVSQAADISLEVDGREIFRGIPGQHHDRRVIRLTSHVLSARVANAKSSE